MRCRLCNGGCSVQLDEWIETFQEAAAVKESEYDINVTKFKRFRNHSHHDDEVKNIYLHFDQENTALVCLTNLKQKFLAQFFSPFSIKILSSFSWSSQCDPPWVIIIPLWK